MGTSLPARRLHPVSPVFDVVAMGRQAAVPVLVALGSGGARLVLPAVLVLVALRYLAWSRRTYSVAGGVLRLDEGVLGRTQRVVPVERVQQVDEVRKLRHRLLRVVTVRVETAGSGDASELLLEVVSAGEAARLRQALLLTSAAGPGPGEEPATGPAAGRPGTGTPAGAGAGAGAGTVIVALGLADLALAGVTGAKLGVVLTLGASLTQLADDLPGGVLARFDPSAVVPGSPLGAAVAAVLLLPAWLALAAAASILVDAGFTLARRGDDLVVRHGLLDRREAVVPAGRVQVVRLDQSPLRRLLGLASLRFQSAGAAGRDSPSLTVPLLRLPDVDRVVAAVLPGAAPWPPLRPAPPAALRRAVTRHVVPAAILAAALAVVDWRAGAAVAAVVLPAAVLAGRSAYAGLGHAVGGGFLVTRRGGPGRRTTVVPVAKAQSARVVSSPFQRRAGLGTLAVDVAAPGPVPEVVDVGAATAAGLAGRVLGREPAPPC